MKRIMIVDDEILVRVGMKSIINWEEHDYSIVAEASNGEEAIRKITECKPDIVFTDLVMEQMDGFELIKKCSAEFPTVKFIVLSSFNDFDSVKKAMKLGAVDYVFKLTAKPDELLKILDETSKIIASEKDSAHDELDTIVRQNIPAIKSRLINMAIQKSYINEADFLKEFNILGISTDFKKPYAIFYITINDFVKKQLEGSISDVQLLKFSMENMIHEIINKNNTAEVYNYENGDLIVIINIASDCTYEILSKRISNDFEILSEYMKRYLGIEISAYLSPILSSINHLPNAVCEAEKLLGYQLSSEKKRLYIQEEPVRQEIMVVKNFVRNNLQIDLSVNTVAKLVNMSESYFSHVFKKEVGVSFTDFVNELRVQKAAELLRKSNLKINEIACEVGLYNANYFSTLFKKVIGTSPNDYRSEKQIKEF